MILHIAVLLGFQLVGEVTARLIAPGLPGPVIGFALLVLVFALRPHWAEAMAPTATTILAHLSLFFVPAGVGVITQLPRLGDEGAAIIITLVLSTLIAIAVSALAFIAATRLMGGHHD